MGVAIRNNNGIYELPGKLPNNSSLSILGKKNSENSPNCMKFHPYAKCSCQNENVVNTNEKLRKTRY